MAENLAYFLPGGAADGCITWGEKQDIKPEDIAVDTTNITVIISDEKYAEIYMSVVNDPNHDWQAEAGVSNALLGMFLSNFYIPYGQTRFTETMAYYKAFYDVLIVKLEAERQAQRQDYIDRIIAEKAQIPITHRDKAEASNGGYVADNGYLYSYEALPKPFPQRVVGACRLTPIGRNSKRSWACRRPRAANSTPGAAMVWAILWPRAAA